MEVSTLECLPVYVIEIAIGQFLLPYERRRIKRLSTSYKNLFNIKTTISILSDNSSLLSSSSLSVI